MLAIVYPSRFAIGHAFTFADLAIIFQEVLSPLNRQIWAVVRYLHELTNQGPQCLFPSLEGPPFFPSYGAIMLESWYGFHTVANIANPSYYDDIDAVVV